MINKNCKRFFLVSYNGIANSGGVERVCYYLSQVLQENDFDVIIVSKEFIQSTTLGKIFKLFGLKIPVLMFPIISSLFLIFNTRQNDRVITHGFNCPFYRSDILFIHGTWAGFTRALKYKLGFKSRLILFFEKTAIKLAKKAVSVSKNAVSESCKYYLGSRRKLFYILNNTVDQSVFFPIEKGHNEHITVLYCGRLDYGKGLNDLLTLAQEVEKSDRFRLKMAINNPTNAELFKDYSNTNIYVNLDIENLNHFYNSGDVFFFSSLYEGFEMVTLEALCSGIPVVGNPVGAIGELYSNKCPGVSIIHRKSTFTAQIESFYQKYNTMDRRLSLHQFYSENYGINIYKQKLIEIVDNN